MATFLCYGIFTGNTNHQKVKIGTTCLELNTKAMASSVPGLGLGAPSNVLHSIDVMISQWKCPMQNENEKVAFSNMSKMKFQA